MNTIYQPIPLATTLEQDDNSATDLIAAMTGLRFAEVARVIVALRLLGSIDAAVPVEEFVNEPIPDHKPGGGELVPRSTLIELERYAAATLTVADYGRLRLARYTS